MRRGHPGMGGWRNENSRHFRPRNGGNQHFRPSRGYGLLDQHRFPPPVSRPHRPSTAYKHRSGDERTRHDYHVRGKHRSDYRTNSYQRNQEDIHQSQDPQIYSMSRQTRSTETYNNSSKYPQEPTNYYESPSKHCHMNSMGDIDDRYVPPREPFQQNSISPWACNANQFDERSHRYEHSKPSRYESAESNKLPLYDYPGHRPPSSDHYGGNPTPVINNSGSFNRSVDDTVDLIRKRLLNRNDPHSEVHDSDLSHHPIENQAVQKTNESIPSFHEEQRLKKKINRQRQSEKSNSGTSFTNIKSKIVNQLFKMDKEKIHKLMDNPNSSSKFEYAISSLITESQYSFNRHLRSVAEKSLHTSRSIDFMQNDNNTIYEDTFMKQMQCILDPQDTVLLEDIKPIVMAELSKALQLHEYEQQFKMGDEVHHQDNQQRYDEVLQQDNQQEYDKIHHQDNHQKYDKIHHQDNQQKYDKGHQQDNQQKYDNIHHQDNQQKYDEIHRQDDQHRYDGVHHRDNQHRYDEENYNNKYFDDSYTYDDYTQYSATHDQKLPISQLDNTVSEREQDLSEAHIQNYDKNHSIDYDINDTMYESHTRRRSQNLSPEAVPTIVSPQYTRKSLDARLNELFSNKTHSTPENPMFSPTKSPECQHMFVPNTEPIEDEDDPFAELDKQYHVAVDHSFIENDDSSSLNLGKNEDRLSSPNSNANISLNLNTPEKESIKLEIDHQLQDMANSPLKLSLCVANQNIVQEEEINKNSLPVADKPMNVSNESINSPHVAKPTCTKLREEIECKEVKKEIEKSENPHYVSKTSFASANRKRSVDQSPCHRKEKRKKSNSISNDAEKPFKTKNVEAATNDNVSKVSKKDDTQSFPEKHIKRKESQKKTDQKDIEGRKKLNSTESVISSISPKESTLINKSQSKSEGKATLKTFDLFTEQPKKVNIHQAHRNTALAPASNIKTISEPKTKNPQPRPNKLVKINAPIQTPKNMHSVQVQTIELKTTCSRFSQTDKKKHLTKAIQTNISPPTPTKNDPEISIDPLDRMKEIDMEIQVLLQEKFKLYSSIESKCSGKNSLHTLGMTVLNVSPFEEQNNDNLCENETQDIDNPEDSIVDDFTNIPVQELEQIAFESIETSQTDIIKPDTRKRRLRVMDKSKSQSPIPANQKKSNKKRKSPNISLIEQIISDERPIEDIISLDDLEDKPVKSRVRNLKSKRKAKRKSSIVTKPPTPPENENLVLKECSVLIVREDFSKYLPVINLAAAEAVEAVQSEDSLFNSESVIESQNRLPDVPIVNDIHFDMLDVSEDIVIGDICEIKCVDDKEEMFANDIPITEDIILDNSQSSIEENQGSTSDPKENECKMFDYSSDENLRRDSVVVTGNADAVLAIECIEDNFIAACLDGNVYYFSGEGQLITTLRGSNLAVTCLTIVKEKYGTTVYTGSLDSRIRYYDLDTGLEKGPECNVLSPIQTMDRAWDTVFVGTRTGFVLQFECKNNMLIPVSTVQFSEQSILALRAMKEGPRKVLLVAARSEDVTIKDAQTGLLLRTLAGPKMTVYTLLYEDGKIYCGTSSSQIHVFDYSSGSHAGAHEGGKGAVCLRAAGGLLFAGCYDGCVYVFREGERRPLAQLRGPGLMLLSLAVVGTKIIAGYKDRSLYIWKIPLSILQEMIL